MSLYMPFTMNNQEYLSIGEHREHRYLLKVSFSVQWTWKSAGKLQTV